ncbi:hypothetical protein GCM10011611_37640 [Aliidongia dinghuensis]|uniref:Uncharacterized protein n=1 Tax=Aliidongia dinghuensis TaxID=1867774 RepID=A0A8J3E4Y3_9PROT|nr:hypothetical protein GCM10011611_37640 [Aliidongia dinghuensis]
MAFVLIILGFVALLVIAGLFIRRSFPAGPAAPSSAPPKPAAAIAGRYTGYTTLQTGICSLGVHEFVLVVDENGNAKSDYAMKEGKFLTGTVAPNGKVKLAFRENGASILFDGQVQDGHITGTSSASSDRTCTIHWDLTRN